MGAALKRLAAVLIPAAIGIAIGIGAWKYFTGPRRVAEKWLACHGANKSLVTASDQQYWDEAHRGEKRNSFQAFDDACLESSTIDSISIRGRSAEVTVRRRRPDLTYQEMTEFPAAATRAERNALIRERASLATEFSEITYPLKLRLEGLEWRVLLNLEDSVLFDRELHAAQDLERTGDDAGAMASYDNLASRPGLDPDRVKWIRELRLNVVAKKACRSAARQYLKYPESTEFDLVGTADLTEKGPILVHGVALAPNVFGVKGRLSVSCAVTLSPDRPKASVKLFMVPENDLGSLVSEDLVEVDL